MDNPLRQLTAARKALAALSDARLLAASPVYKTEPQNKKEQAWFYNQIVHLACELPWSPLALLDELLAIEVTLGRHKLREERFGPRPIDLDLLLFGAELCKNERLCLPHPRMFERAFVLVPLQDIAQDLVFPDGRSLQTCLAALAYRVQADCIYQ